MMLYFFRHAQAEDEAPTDFDRQLTRRGIARTKTAAKVLLRLDISPKFIYSSPRLRALETAEIIADALAMDVQLHDGLDVGFTPAVVEELVRYLSVDDEIMFVGHEPSMSEVVGAVVGGRVVMKKGGMARVDVPFYTSPLKGELVWLIAPKVFDTLGIDSV